MTKEIDNIQDKVNWHWRNSMRPVRFFAFDARSSIIVPMLIFYFRLETIVITIMILSLFRYLERKGLTFPSAMRNLRAWVVGSSRPGWLSAEKKKFIDWG